MQSDSELYEAPTGVYTANILADMYFVMGAEPTGSGSARAATKAGRAPLALNDRATAEFYRLRQLVMANARYRMNAELELICSAEIAHIFDCAKTRQAISRLKKRFPDRNIDMWAGCVQHGSLPFGITPEQKDEIEKYSSPDKWAFGSGGYVSRWRRQKQAEAITGLTIADVSMEVFRANISWAGSYGGVLWHYIARAWRDMRNARSLHDLYEAIDHVAALEHNTATLFNKCSHHSSPVGEVLDVKFLVNSPVAMLPHLSASLETWVNKNCSDPRSGTASTLPCVYRLGEEDGAQPIAFAETGEVFHGDEESLPPTALDATSFLPHSAVLMASAEQKKCGIHLDPIAATSHKFTFAKASTGSAFATKPNGKEVEHCVFTLDELWANYRLWLKYKKIHGVAPDAEMTASSPTNLLLDQLASSSPQFESEWKKATDKVTKSITKSSNIHHQALHTGGAFLAAWEILQEGMATTQYRRRWVFGGDASKKQLRLAVRLYFQEGVGTVAVGTYIGIGSAPHLSSHGTPFALAYFSHQGIPTGKIMRVLLNQVLTPLCAFLDEQRVPGFHEAMPTHHLLLEKSKYLGARSVKGVLGPKHWGDGVAGNDIDSYVKDFLAGRLAAKEAAAAEAAKAAENKNDEEEEKPAPEEVEAGFTVYVPSRDELMAAFGTV